MEVRAAFFTAHFEPLARFVRAAIAAKHTFMAPASALWKMNRKILLPPGIKTIPGLFSKLKLHQSALRARQ